MIILAADHAGFKHKEVVKTYLDQESIEYADMGAHTEVPTDDYPEIMIPAARAVADDPHMVGIFFGGSGQGEAMVANKVKGIRAVVLHAYNEDIIRLSKEHNNANVLAIGARFVTEEEAIKVVALWLSTEFSKDERHVRRIAQITTFEQQ